MSLLAVAAVSGALVAGPPPPLEPTAAAPIVIAGQPISRGHLRHWADIARRLPSLKPARAQAAEYVIGFRWLRAEARELGVNVRSTEVEQTFREQREEAFPNARAFRRYLRRSGQTSDDVRLRVRTDLLTQRLRDLAIEGATTPAEERERLDAYVAAFRRKWRARTVCRAPWVSRSDCGAIR